MIPDGELSTRPIPGNITGGRSQTVDPVEDFETGGVALDDGTQGLLVRVWRAYIENDEIYIDAAGIAPIQAYAGSEISEVSLAFDQNMRYALAIVEGGTAKLNWYDTTILSRTTLVFENAITPRICMDDKRELATGENDIILAYVKSSKLYCRLQRDRFTVEYLLADLPASAHLIRFGLSDKLRLQFELSVTENELPDLFADLFQTAFRFRNDDGNQANATWLAGQGVSIDQGVGSGCRIRMQIDTLNDADPELFRIEHRILPELSWTPVPLAEGAAIGPTLNQTAFRFRNDDGLETAATWKAAEDLAINLPAAAAFRLRTQVNSDQNVSARKYQIEYRHTPSGQTPGSWEAI